MSTQFINLEDNGKLFPSWVLSNFKKYKLPEIVRKEGEDPCLITTKEELKLYQQFLSSFLSYKSSFKDILIYHGLGSGKTVSAINIYNVLFNYTPKWNIYILIKASLHNDPWLKDLKVWLDKNDNSLRMSNIKFIHYDSPFADREFIELIKHSDAAKQTMFIIDEAHNFIKNVYNNINSKTGKRAHTIYDLIQQEKKEDTSTRVILLSATPAVNNPYELALMFNLLRENTFPENEVDFNQLFISPSDYESLNSANKNMFQRRIMGLVSYYIGATPDLYAEKTISYKNINMSPYYKEVYEVYEAIEKEQDRIRKKFSRGKVGDKTSTYSSNTRQASNFVFPSITSKINGETRPRPSHFRLSTTEANVIDEAKTKKALALLKSKQAADYHAATRKFILSLISFWKDLHKKDKEKDLTLQDNVKTILSKYNGNINNFIKAHEPISKLFDSMFKCSPKMINIIFNIYKCKNNVLIYSNYVEMEGLEVLKIYLRFFGYNNIIDKNHKKGYVFMEYHGGIDKVTRETNKQKFNSVDNKNGNLIKIILLSPAGTEGINLRNVTHVHIMEPYWNEVRMDQLVGRAIRQCSHADLPMNERKVNVFRYKMIRKNGKETTDEKMEKIARRKNNLIQSFLDVIREVAVDCELFKEHNMMGAEYKCFNFNEDALFDENIGPAYTKDFIRDKRLDNGLNAPNSYVVRIKVKKIQAVKQINNVFSEKQDFWYYPTSNVVYDYDGNYPVGKVKKDEFGNPEKINKDTYIIDNIIKIPMIKNI
jgi:superfamily II DNA or RNA helicase